MREEKPKLSAKDRLVLIQTINALPPTQFDELVFALNPPKGIVSSSNAPQGARSKELLDWLNGPSGPGLTAADEVLQVLIPKTTKTAPQPVAFVMDGKVSRSTASELQAFVELLRKKTRDDSIDIPTPLTLRRTTRTVQVFVEPLLEVGSALPLHMVLVPGGTFLMGSPDDEPEREVGEDPQHEVTVPAFFMGRYPVTQAQWRVVATLPQIERELAPDPSNFKGGNRPVENVSWYDAMEFCARLSTHTGRPYRLPSEAEWEYACRAGTTTPFHVGKTLTTDVANYNGNYTYGDGPKGECPKETTPVDHFGMADAFGLCDMHGNVWEWCQDYWHDSYEGAPTDGSAWIEGGNSELRILRGGSWYLNPQDCRSAYRFGIGPDFPNHQIGFRVVCSAPRTLQLPTG